PGPRLAVHAQALEGHERRLERAVQATLVRERERLAALTGRLEGLSPLRVLARGYSLTRTGGGEVVLNADQLQPGDEIETRLAEGSFRAQVLETQRESGAAPERSEGSPEDS
ncbi:MAG: exodeoxyribonuclease VII large subunit, partial [Planctomycetes bacterium]|nr:exodeoxyribonuclease VII large subunit [Planctomycetota bacterium]